MHSRLCRSIDDCSMAVWHADGRAVCHADGSLSCKWQVTLECWMILWHKRSKVSLRQDLLVIVMVALFHIRFSVVVMVVSRFSCDCDEQHGDCDGF